MTAHRFAYIDTHGPIDDTLVIRHTCDNPPCCNPRHLVPGTHKQNSEDRDSRGRGADVRGERNPATHLTWEDVRAIRAAYAAGVLQR